MNFLLITFLNKQIHIQWTRGTPKLLIWQFKTLISPKKKRNPHLHLKNIKKMLNNVQPFKEIILLFLANISQLGLF